MAVDPRSEPHESMLSKSWTDISDVDTSTEDELQSETTDAASLVDHSGPDDVYSLDGRGSDTGSLDAASEMELATHPRSGASLDESTKTVSPLHSPSEQAVSGTSPTWSRADIVGDWEASRLSRSLASFTGDAALKILGGGLKNSDDVSVFGSVCVPQSNHKVRLNRPLRVSFSGNSEFRPQIVAKLADALLSAGLEPEGSTTQPEPSDDHSGTCSDVAKFCSIDSQAPYRMTGNSDRRGSTSRPPTDLGGGEVIMLDSYGDRLAAWHEDDAKRDTERFPAWTQPDLAVFFVSSRDTPLRNLKQQKLHRKVAPLSTAKLVITETPEWTFGSPALPVDDASPHLVVEARYPHRLQATGVSKDLPIDLQTFLSLETDRLSRNLDYCLRQSRNVRRANTSSPPTTMFNLCWSGWRSGEWQRKIAGTAVALTATLLITMMTLLAAHVLTSSHVIPAISPSFTRWSRSSLSPSTVATQELSVPKPIIHSRSAISSPYPNSVTTRLISSDVAEFVASESLKSANRSARFQVQSVGDGHLIVKTPRGFKPRLKSSPFDLTVARDGQPLNASVAQLFEGVYSVHVDRSEAYGLLQVAIQPHRSAPAEWHQINCGSPWFRAADWKWLVHIVSDQAQDQLENMHTTIASASDRIRESLRDGVMQVSDSLASRAATIRARGPSVVHQNVVMAKGRLHEAHTIAEQKLRSAHQRLISHVDSSRQHVRVSVETADHYRRNMTKKLAAVAQERWRHIGATYLRPTPFLLPDLAHIPVAMQDLVRSEHLAKAQERSKQLVADLFARAGSSRPRPSPGTNGWQG